MVKEICPIAVEAFEEHVLHGMRLSRSEVRVLKDILNSRPIGSIDEKVLKTIEEKLGYHHKAPE